MAKLKKLVKENFSVVGGVVSTPAINTWIWFFITNR